MLTIAFWFFFNIFFFFFVLSLCLCDLLLREGAIENQGCLKSTTGGPSSNRILHYPWSTCRICAVDYGGKGKRERDKDAPTCFLVLIPFFLWLFNPDLAPHLES